jgi:hypothetical protein
VRWDLVRKPEETEQALGFRVHTDLDTEVGVITIFPGIRASQLEQWLAPPLRGCVLRTFGAGNLPSNEALYDVLRAATARGVVIVNVTQCFTGTVVQGHYEVRYRQNSHRWILSNLIKKLTCFNSAQLDAARVTSGSDMTTEAALTKLMWLMGRHRGDVERVRQRLAEEIRGELNATEQTRRTWRGDGRRAFHHRTSTRSQRKSSSIDQHNNDNNNNNNNDNDNNHNNDRDKLDFAAAPRSPTTYARTTSSASDSSSPSLSPRSARRDTFYAQQRQAPFSRPPAPDAEISGGLEPSQHNTFGGNALQQPAPPPSAYAQHHDAPPPRHEQLASSWPTIGDDFGALVSQSMFYERRISVETSPTEAAIAAVAALPAANLPRRLSAAIAHSASLSSSPNDELMFGSPSSSSVTQLPVVPYKVCRRMDHSIPLLESRD